MGKVLICLSLVTRFRDPMNMLEKGTKRLNHKRSAREGPKNLWYLTRKAKYRYREKVNVLEKIVTYIWKYSL
jgi:phage terminase small subunit